MNTKVNRLKNTGKRLQNWDEDFAGESPLTTHAKQQLAKRHITEEQIQRVIDCGREVHERHATIYFIGDKEVSKDPALADCNGIHVICSVNGSTVVTAYRNKQFLKEKYTLGQKPRRSGLKRRFGTA